MNEPRFIAFDLDGTLVDSRQDLADSANDMLASYGARPIGLDAVTGMVGDGARQLVERALSAAGLDPLEAGALERFLRIYDRRLVMHTRPYAGLIDAVHAASRRVPLGLVTNKPERQTRRILDTFGIAADFTWVIGGDSTFPRKPDPAGLLHLIGEAGAAPADTLFVGDSMIDVQTARRAGCAVCVAGYGFGRSREPLSLRGDEWIAETSLELPPLLEAFIDGRRPGAASEAALSHGR